MHELGGVQGRQEREGEREQHRVERPLQGPEQERHERDLELALGRRAAALVLVRRLRVALVVHGHEEGLEVRLGVRVVDGELAVRAARADDEDPVVLGPDGHGCHGSGGRDDNSCDGD